jgi:hypothetical protein
LIIILKRTPSGGATIPSARCLSSSRTRDDVQRLANVFLGGKIRGAALIRCLVALLILWDRVKQLKNSLPVPGRRRRGRNELPLVDAEQLADASHLR